MSPRVALVGAGPGDPALLTLAGLRALANADVVLYDALVHPSVLEHAHAGAELRFVGKRAGHEGASQDEINAMLVALARQGRRVCRLKGGDPFLFGRGSEEAEVLAGAGIDFEVVPGVTAAVGVTAYAGIPLTHRTLSSSVALLTSSEHANKAASSHDWSRLATATQTLVLYMGARRVREEMSRLIAHGRAPQTPAAAIQWGTRAAQRVVVGTVADLGDRCEAAQLGPPALVVVGEVVALRERLAWFERRTLFGRRILVTRAREQASGLSEALLARGAEPVGFATIAFAPPTDAGPLVRAIQNLQSYDLVIFTSVNGVVRFFDAVRDLGGDARSFGAARVVAVGTSTAGALWERGIRADAVAAEHRGEAAASAALSLWAAGSTRAPKILLARAEVAREALPEMLRDAGAQLDVVAAYRTVAPAGADVDSLRDALRNGEIDAALFTSASTVEQLCAVLGSDAAELLSPVLIAAIGPLTAEAAERHGLRVSVQPATYTIDALVGALEAHYGRD